jgi:hypothetical protein
MYRETTGRLIDRRQHLRAKEKTPASGEGSIGIFSPLALCFMSRQVAV